MSARGFLFPILHRAMLSIMSEHEPHWIPKSRAWFIWCIAADAHHRWGYSVAEAVRFAPSLMRDLEEACAPWGDPDYDWSVGAAREWAQECLASDEDAEQAA